MEDELVVGSPQEWEPFRKRHPVLLERLPNLTKTLEIIMNRKWSEGESIDTLIFIAGHMAIDDFMEILTLCGNSEGHGATKILRAMFERVVTLKYLHKHPDQFQRFYNYYWVTKRKLANAIDQYFQKDFLSPEQMKELTENYNKVKDDYKITECETCGTTRMGYAWTPTDMVTMAKDVGMSYQLVSSYYLPLDETHPTVRGMLDRIEIIDDRIVMKERLGRELSDRVLVAAHLLVLQALETQVEHFSLDPAAYKTVEQDFMDVWKRPPEAEQG